MDTEIRDRELVGREVQLLQLLSDGADLSAAARAMGVSERTARRIARDLEYKLRARTLLQAIYIAAKRGLI